MPSRVSLFILNTRVESGAYSRDSSRFSRRRPFIYAANRHPVSLEFIWVMQIGYRWRSLPRVRRHRASNPQGSSRYGCCLFRHHHGPINVCALCVCVVIPFILDVRLVDAPAGVTQEEGHTGFLHLPSAMLASIFLARRIQPFLSLVDREVKFSVLAT